MQEKQENNNVTAEEIISSLTPLNNAFFHIDDLPAYADKISRLGKTIALRNEENSRLLSYILYYDNGPEVFISMVWTNPEQQGRGLASKLLNQLIQSSQKDILLEVNPNNPAKYMYEKFNFLFEKNKDENIIMRYSKRLSIMQPYIFPYIGYFHLLQASDMIVFYDDVNFIKKGWINRNRILLNGKDHMFTIPVEDASQFRAIKETVPLLSDKFREKFHRQIQMAYAKAPFYKDVSGMIHSVFNEAYHDIASLAINSILAVYQYLGKPIKHTRSSICSPSTIGMEKAERLIRITKDLGYNKYINLPGGKELYNKEYFHNQGIELSFVESREITYKQFSGGHIPSLSILDVLMFNDKRSVNEKLAAYSIT